MGKRKNKKEPPDKNEKREDKVINDNCKYAKKAWDDISSVLVLLVIIFFVASVIISSMTGSSVVDLFAVMLDSFTRLITHP